MTPEELRAARAKQQPKGITLEELKRIRAERANKPAPKPTPTQQPEELPPPEEPPTTNPLLEYKRIKDEQKKLKEDVDLETLLAKVQQESDQYSDNSTPDTERERMAGVEQLIEELVPRQSRQASPEEEAQGPEQVTEIGPGGETITTTHPRYQTMAGEIARSETAPRSGEDLVQGTAPKKPIEVQPTLSQSLGLEDRSSTVGDAPEPASTYTPREIPLSSYLDMDLSKLSPGVQEKVAELRKQVPEEMKETPTALGNDFFPEVFVKEYSEAPLQRITVDPMRLTSGDMMRHPVEVIDDLSELYFQHEMMVQHRDNPDVMQISPEEEQRLRSWARSEAEARVAAVSRDYGEWNLGVIKDVDQWIDHLEQLSPIDRPFAALMTPGAYAVFKDGDQLSPQIAYRNEDAMSWTFRAAASTAVMSYLMDPESTWEFGGEHGFGGRRHLWTELMGYQAGESYGTLHQQFQDQIFGKGSGEVSSAVTHGILFPTFFTALVLEPDFWSVSGGVVGFATSAAARAPGVAGDMLASLKVRTLGRVSAEAKFIDELVDAQGIGVLDQLAKTPDVRGLVAQSVLREVNLDAVNKALEVKDPTKIVPERSAVQLLKPDENAPAYMPPEVARLGARHATPEIAVEVAEAQAAKMDAVREQVIGRTKDAIDDAKRLLSEANPSLSRQVSQLSWTRDTLDKAKTRLAEVANRLGAQLSAFGEDLPSFRTSLNPRQVLFELTKNKGALYNALVTFGERWNVARTTNPAVRKFLENELSKLVADTGKTILRGADDLSFAAEVAAYNSTQQAVRDLIGQVAGELRKLGGKEAIAAAHNIERLPKWWAVLDDLRQRTITGRNLKLAAQSSPEVAKRALADIRRSVEALVSEEKVGKPKFEAASYVRPDSPGAVIDLDTYGASLRARYGQHVYDTVRDSRLGEVLRELDKRTLDLEQNRMVFGEGYEQPKVMLTGDDVARLTVFEDGLNAERYFRSAEQPTARAQSLLTTIRHGWQPHRETLSVTLYRALDRFARVLDLPGASEIGKLDPRLQTVMRRTYEQQRLGHRHLMDVAAGRAKPLVPNHPDGTVKSGVWAVRDLLTTRRKYEGILLNQDWLTPHEKAWKFLKSSASGDDFGGLLAARAIAGAPLGSFDPASTRLFGGALALVQRIAKTSKSADAFVDQLFESLPMLFFKELGRTEIDAATAMFVFNALHFASVEYDGLTDLLRLFGPGISGEDAKLFNWVRLPERGTATPGDIQKAFRVSAQYQIPLAKEMKGRPPQPISNLLRKEAIASRTSAELARAGVEAGYGLYIPDAYRVAIESMYSSLAKEMVEFSDTVNATGLVGMARHPLRFLLNMYDLGRTAAIAGFYLPRFAFPIGNLWSNAIQMTLEAGGAKRAVHASASTLSHFTEMVGMPETAALLQKFDPVVEQILGMPDDGIIHFPGRSVRKADFLREAEADGVFQYLASPELERDLRKKLRSLKGSDPEFGPSRLTDLRMGHSGVAPTLPDAAEHLVETAARRELPPPESRLVVNGGTPALVEFRGPPNSDIWVWSSEGAGLRAHRGSALKRYPTIGALLNEMVTQAAIPGHSMSRLSLIDILEELRKLDVNLAVGQDGPAMVVYHVLPRGQVEEVYRTTRQTEHGQQLYAHLYPPGPEIQGAPVGGFPINRIGKNPDGSILVDAGEAIPVYYRTPVELFQRILAETGHYAADIVKSLNERGMGLWIEKDGRNYVVKYALPTQDQPWLPRDLRGKIRLVSEDEEIGTLEIYRATANSPHGRSLRDAMPGAKKPKPRTPKAEAAPEPEPSPTLEPQTSQEPSVPEEAPPVQETPQGAQGPAPSPLEGLLPNDEVQARAARLREERARRQQIDTDLAEAQTSPRLFEEDVDGRVNMPASVLDESQTAELTRPGPPPVRKVVLTAREKLKPYRERLRTFAHHVLYDLDVAASPQLIDRFMEACESLEARNRLAYYARVQMEGSTREQAAARMRYTLYDFTTGLPAGESAGLGRFFMVWRYRRLWLRQMGEMLTKSITGPEEITTWQHLTHQTPIGRTSRLYKAMRYAPHSIDWNDETDNLSDDDQVEQWMLRETGWWAKARPFFDVGLTDEEGQKAWRTSRGRLVTAEEVAFMGASTFDELYLLNALFQTSMIPLHGGNVATTPSVANQWVNEVTSWVDPRFDDAVSAGVKAAIGIDGDRSSQKGVLVPQNQVPLIRALMRMTNVNRFGYIEEDRDGQLRVDEGFWPMLQMIVQGVPQFNDAARILSYVQNPQWRNGVGPGIREMLGEATGIAETRGFDPLTQHNYEVVNRTEALNQLLNKAEAGVPKED